MARSIKYKCGGHVVVDPAWLLKGKPYQVQLEALRRSRGRSHYAYFIEMGMGKSPLTLNDYADQFAQEIDTIIVICPNSFKSDWKLMSSEWGLDMKSGMWPHDDLRPGMLYSINFEAVRSSGYPVIQEMMDSRPCFLVIDEGSAIKNPRSLQAKAVLDLSKRAKAVRLLNGTPMANNPLDLFAQLKCVGEINGVNQWAFKYKFCKLGGYMGKQIVGAQNEQELHKILDRCSFRALKTDWSDLPPKIMVPVRLEMTPKQKFHYRRMLEDFLTEIDTHTFDAPTVLTQMDKLRQVASGILLDGKHGTLIDPPHQNPKIKAALEIYEGGPGKLVISYFYTMTGAILMEEMARNKLNPAYICGGMTDTEIQEQKTKFNKDPSCRVLVGQITSASLAHTLTGDEGNNRASRMIFHDQTFSYIARKQMEDRIHRGEQDRACLYYDLLLSPIDEAQIRALDTKADMASLVVDAVRALRGPMGLS